MKWLAAAVLFVLIAIAAVTPIRSYDYFWHLAAGRWIVEHRALPIHDPLAVASAKTPWINGEWLYEVIADGLHQFGGDQGMSVWNALLIAAIFTLGFRFAARDHDAGIAALAAAVAFAGASDLLGVRPAAVAALLVTVAIGLLGSRASIPWLAASYAAVTIIWINVHPSALIAPLLAALAMLIDVRRWLVAAASAAALLINPYGWRAVWAPISLTSQIRSGEYVNAEWQTSPIEIFPLLYATMVVVVLAFLMTPEKRRDAWRLAIFVVLAVLAWRYVRNQGLYFAALPLLLPPLRPMTRRASAIVAACALIPLGWAFHHDVHKPGVDAERFPLIAVGALKATRLPGNIYNVDQFGGLIEWTFYPERRALTDGRNELFREFIAEDAQARRDSRAWRALIEKYHVALAVEEYSPEKIDVTDVATGERRRLPASLVRYRRRDWALIAFDDAAMVFARRAAFPPQRIEPIEYRHLVPDDPAIGYPNPQIRAAALKEIARARQQFGNIRVVRELERGAAE